MTSEHPERPLDGWGICRTCQRERPTRRGVLCDHKRFAVSSRGPYDKLCEGIGLKPVRDTTAHRMTAEEIEAADEVTA